MKCAICDTEDETISFDTNTGKFTDCRVCREVITDTLESYDIEEDEDDEFDDVVIPFDDNLEFWLVTTNAQIPDES